MSSNHDQAQSHDALPRVPVKKSTGEGSDSALSEMLKKRRETHGDGDRAADRDGDESDSNDVCG